MQTIKEYINDEKIRREYVKDLRSLVEIPSVVTEPDGIYPYGKNCADVLDKAIEIADRFGFKTENHDYHCASAVYGEGNKEIGIIAHLDVVPAGNGWSYEPYALTVDKDLLIGRGTLDDKGPFMSALYAMRYFADNGIKLPFSVRLIMGSDEEVGSTDLQYYKSVKETPDFSFTPDADFPVCIGEKGIMSIKIDLGEVDPSITDICAGTVTNAVPGEAYAVVNGEKYTAIGATAHASTPDKGLNAIALLVDMLEEKGLIKDSDKKKLDFLRRGALDTKGNVLGIAFEDEYFGGLTCTESVMKLEDGRIHQYYNIRYPMSKSFEELDSIAKATVEAHGFTVISSQGDKGYFNSPDSAEIKALTDACETTLGYTCKPYTMGGGTYARHMEGAVAFGGRIEEFNGKLGAGKGCCHDRDEYYAIGEAEKSVEIFIRALTNLGNIQG